MHLHFASFNCSEFRILVHVHCFCIQFLDAVYFHGRKSIQPVKKLSVDLVLVVF